MKPRANRTAVAALCTAAAIGLPSLAWFVAGSRSVEDEVARLAAEPSLRAREEAEHIAQRLAVRLEALRHSESRRSYLDYRLCDESATDACECPSPSGSPLALGPADPLVWAHFEIDEVGQLTLPTFDAHRHRDADPEAAGIDLAVQRKILEELECVRATRLAPLLARADADRRAGQPLVVGPFFWHTVELEGRPALVALREVALPTAIVTQGLVVRAGELQTLLDSPGFPASLRAGPPAGPSEARVPFEGDPWTVAVDPSGAGAQALALGSKARARFYRSFAGGMLAALLAGGLLVSLVAQAERLARQRARFAASAAHELRTPLAGLRLYGELLADGLGDPSRAETYARRIAAEAERLGRVVSNVLGFSRLERGPMRVQTQAGDLGEAVRDSVERLRPALEAGGARIELSIAPALPQARFDRDSVHQILQNLLDNAAKYGQNGTDGPIEVGLISASRGLTLRVVDHGPGVEPAVRRRLFRPFVRHSSPDAPAGLGLGLALVQGLAVAQHATVAYDQQADGGASFSVTFPAAA